MYNTTGLLSKDVKDPKTSIGQYLRTNFPNAKPLQAEYKALAGGGQDSWTKLKGRFFQMFS